MQLHSKRKKQKRDIASKEIQPRARAVRDSGRTREDRTMAFAVSQKSLCLED
ncbi:uncharacterized protein TrAtP1_002823 [Trichoderma atroviride]|uniref:uncharacterized protein n=1 Tax=Hypocrea atroviridis TaxID=63577 RepID=UPI00331BCDDC|nr:hypothetical protein TrAtP1_002823 [Trichoderma atroviride]